MLDYQPNTGLAPAFSVFNGQLNTSAYMTPYTIRSYADWVANPGGTPAYYLRLTQYVFNTGGEDYPWSFDLAAYFAANLTVPAGTPNCTNAQNACSSQSQLPLLGGQYTDGQLTNGVAVGVGVGSSLTTVPNAYWFHSTGGTSAHLFFAYVTVSPNQQRVFSWYVMPGTFAAAQAFMANHS